MPGFGFVYFTFVTGRLTGINLALLETGLLLLALVAGLVQKSRHWQASQAGMYEADLRRFYV
jgi:hypothetical protein